MIHTCSEELKKDSVISWYVNDAMIPFSSDGDSMAISLVLEQPTGNYSFPLATFHCNNTLGFIWKF